MADKKDAKEDISEDELDQIIQDMSKDETEAASSTEKPVLELVQGKKKAAPAASSHAQGGGQQALTLEMNGVVNLKLHFKSGERSIEVHCTEDYLTCTMADGTEFKIPTGNSGKVRKAV
jgi:hypothetical protein